MDNSLSIRPYTIIGSTTSKDAFSRVFLFQPMEESLKETRGELFVIFSASVPGLEVDWEKVAVESFNHLKETYYSNITGGALPALEVALEETRQNFHKIISAYIPEGMFPTIDLHLGALIVWGGSLLFRASGNVFFSLFRNGELIDMSKDRFVQEPIHDNDAMILGTAVFGERIGVTLLQQILQSELSDDWQRLLRAEVGDVEENALLSGIILNVEIKQHAGEEEVIELIMPGFSDKKPSRLPKIKNPFSRLPLPRLDWLSKLTGKFGRAEVYLKTPSAPRSLKKWIMVFLLGLMLMASIFFTLQRNRSVEIAAENNVLQQEIEAKLVRVGELAQEDPEQAQRALAAVEEQLGAVQGTTDINVDPLLNQTYDLLYTTEYPTWQPIVLEPSIAPVLLYGALDKTMVLSQEGTVTSIAANNIVTRVASEENLAASVFGAYAVSGSYIYHANSGVWYVGDDGRVEKIIEQSGQWGQVLGIKTYLDNLYVLGSSTAQIFKYVGLGNGQLGGGAGYFQEPVSLDNVVDFAIDGHIYLLHRTGQVEKFLGGRRTNFSLQGVYPKLQQPQKIETNIDFSHVYIWDGDSILVFTTQGEYQKRLRSNVGTIKNFTVQKDESRLFILTENGILVTPLGE